ncbi:MAG TPA: DMT family transporter [Candidatus Sulfotelmatobacter sp.]|nr:DMT family transporter [Candidatus Sulfotelmatobacter sp.]
MNHLAVEIDPPKPVYRDNVVRAIGFICLAFSVFPFMNAGVKFLTPHYSMAQILWARYFGHLILMLLVFMPRRGLRLFATGHLGTQVTRSLAMLASTAFYFLGLKGTPLATAASISFIGPLLVTALSVPMLGEHVGPRRWAAVVIGFVGALIIIRPGTGAVHWSALFVVGSAVAYALYQILSRRMAAHDSPETSVAYAALAGAAVTTLALPFGLRAPDNNLDLMVMLGLGLCGGTGHYFVVKAFETAPASALSPFSYGQLIWATLLGYVVFGDFPDGWTWVGAAVIVVSGLYMIYREAQLKKITAPSPTP